MMLELNDVMAIIAKNNEAMNNVITKWEVEEGDLYPEGLTELRRIVNTFTAQICRAIVKAEDALVGDTLEGMEKSEKDNESKIDIKEAERMNPSNIKQFNELLWLGVPKKDRDSIRGMVSTRYIDPTHVVFVELRHEDSDAFVQLSGDGEFMIKKPEWDRSDESVTMIATNYLKKVVDNITAEHVVIKVKDRYPLTLEWKDGEDSFQVLIAQRVENERRDRRRLRNMRVRLPRL